MTGPVVDAHAARVSETLAPTSQYEDSEGAINHGMNPWGLTAEFLPGHSLPTREELLWSKRKA
jgi:hypothetical protein